MTHRPKPRPRRDGVLWLVSLAVASIATIVADVSGARLGAALTLGVVLVIAIVLGALAWEAQSRRRPSNTTPPTTPTAQAPSRGRAKPRRR